MLSPALMSMLGNGLDTSYQSVLARGTALGYTLPGASQKTKQSAFVTALKSAGVWDLLDVLYVFATDGDSDFATLNWKAPTSFQCSKVNTPTFTANQGFAGNASNMSLNTNWNPRSNGVNYIQDNASHGGHVNTNSANDNYRDWGTYDGTNQSLIRSRAGAGNVLYTTNQGTNSTQVANATSVGFYHLKRTASNAVALFKNGSSLTTDTTVSTNTPNANMFILCFNNNGAGGNFSGNQVSMFFAGASLNGLESAFYTAWNNYFTSL